MNSPLPSCPARLPSPSAPRGWRVLAFSLAALPLFFPAAVGAAEEPEVVAVYSSVSPGYARTLQTDGTFKPETYAFGEGSGPGTSQGAPTADQASFLNIARAIAPSLATQNYRACNPATPRQTDLLIMVYWGTTNGTDAASSPEYLLARGRSTAGRPVLSPAPFDLASRTRAANVGDGNRDPSLSEGAAEAQNASVLQAANDSVQAQTTLMATIANRQRDRQNAENAAILGYLPELKRVEAYKLTSLSHRHQDVVDELEESRYYVVLQAFDFQTLLAHKQKKLLWETRYSIRQGRNDFSRQLAAMTQSASRYFGQASAGLIRTPISGVKVEMGELTSLSLKP